MKKSLLGVVLVACLLVFASTLVADSASIDEWFPVKTKNYFVYKATLACGTKSLDFYRKVIMVKGLNDDMNQWIFVYHDEQYDNGSPYFSNEANKMMGIVWSMRDWRTENSVDKSVDSRYLNWDGEVALHDDILRIAWRIPVMLGTVPYSFSYSDGKVTADYSTIYYDGVSRKAVKVYSRNTLGKETRATTWVVKGIGLVKYIFYDEEYGTLTLQLIRHGRLAP